MVAPLEVLLATVPVVVGVVLVLVLLLAITRK